MCVTLRTAVSSQLPQNVHALNAGRIGDYNEEDKGSIKLGSREIITGEFHSASFINAGATCYLSLIKQ